MRSREIAKADEYQFYAARQSPHGGQSTARHPRLCAPHSPLSTNHFSMRCPSGLPLRFFMHKETLILNSAAMERALTRIAHEIAERNENSAEVALVGIHRGGVFLAKRLAAILSGIWSQTVPVGSMDIGMHRDDLDRQPAPALQPTRIPFDVTGKTVILVDDVLFSGRTTRAALDAMTDLGRPKRVQLAVLIDRGHRELPIKADFVGKNVPTALDQRINVRFHEEGGTDEVTLETGGGA